MLINVDNALNNCVGVFSGEFDLYLEKDGDSTKKKVIIVSKNSLYFFFVYYIWNIFRTDKYYNAKDIMWVRDTDKKSLLEIYKDNEEFVDAHNYIYNRYCQFFKARGYSITKQKFNRLIIDLFHVNPYQGENIHTKKIFDFKETRLEDLNASNVSDLIYQLYNLSLKNMLENENARPLDDIYQRFNDYGTALRPFLPKKGQSTKKDKEENQASSNGTNDSANVNPLLKTTRNLPSMESVYVVNDILKALSDKKIPEIKSLLEKVDENTLRNNWKSFVEACLKNRYYAGLKLLLAKLSEFDKNLSQDALEIKAIMELAEKSSININIVQRVINNFLKTKKM